MMETASKHIGSTTHTDGSASKGTDEPGVAGNYAISLVLRHPAGIRGRLGMHNKDSLVHTSDAADDLKTLRMT